LATTAQPATIVMSDTAAGSPSRAPHFIALEGIDGSGTTSQCGAIETWLAGRGHEVVRTREPSGGAIGRLVRERLAADAPPLDRGALALLFAADRLDHVRSEIEPAVARGAVVLTDRYLLSSLAYQSLDLPLSWVVEINARAPRAHLNVLIDLPADVAVARVARRRADAGAAEEIYDVPATQRALELAYRTLAQREDVGPVATVHGDAPLDEVTVAICESLRDHGL